MEKDFSEMTVKEGVTSRMLIGLAGLIFIALFFILIDVSLDIFPTKSRGVNQAKLPFYAELTFCTWIVLTILSKIQMLIKKKHPPSRGFICFLDCLLSRRRTCHTNRSNGSPRKYFHSRQIHYRHSCNNVAFFCCRNRPVRSDASA